MQADDALPIIEKLRPANEVMRLARLGSAHQTRLSFMRVLLRRLKAQGWTFDRPCWRVDVKGVGIATYRAQGPERTYTLICFSHDLPDDLRSDRVIAEAWDATFTLFDGEPGEHDLSRLALQVPKQEAGRMSPSELVLSRANRSVRLFDHTVRSLADGRQPDSVLVEEIGYLMRTTAVYGGGKFGIADRDKWADRSEFLGSFQPELLTVYLIRWFTVDIVEHLAQARTSGTAARLTPTLRRRLGVGNSTGLGMAPFLINHPLLLNNWVEARERALARVRARRNAGSREAKQLLELVKRARENADHWSSANPIQAPKVEGLKADLDRLTAWLSTESLPETQPWDAVFRWAQTELGLEGQEQLVALLLELYPAQIDELAGDMRADEAAAFPINGTMTVARLRTLLEENYNWALTENFGSRRALARVWYVSAEKLEPRLGERFEEDIEAYEQALAPGRDAHALQACLRNCADDDLVAQFLLVNPAQRHIVRRVQLSELAPYGEIRDNTIAAEMLPIDLLRCKLAFFGATRFDPRSDRWVRITMYQGAPFPEELAQYDPDDVSCDISAMAVRG